MNRDTFLLYLNIFFSSNFHSLGFEFSWKEMKETFFSFSFHHRIFFSPLASLFIQSDRMDPEGFLWVLWFLFSIMSNIEGEIIPIMIMMKRNFYRLKFVSYGFSWALGAASALARSLAALKQIGKWIRPWVTLSNHFLEK